MGSRFDFYEVVRIKEIQSYGDEMAGLEGAVLGKSKDSAKGWYYAVFIYEHGETMMLNEKDIESTGKMDERKSFYSDQASVNVKVDPETGEGWVEC